MSAPDQPRSAGRRAEDAQVSFTVKELLADIKEQQTEGFTRIETALSAKVDKAEVARVEARLDAQLERHAERIDKQDERIEALEDARHDEQTGQVAVEQWTIRTWSRLHKVGAGFVGVFMIAAPILGPYLANHI